MKNSITYNVLTFLILLTTQACSAGTPPPAASGYAATVVKNNQGLEVHINGEFFARYNPEGFTNPILWPVEAPGNIRMLRNWPMISDSQGEEKDHPHHKGIFIGHQRINKTDFWHEGPRGQGRVEQLRLIETRSDGDRAIITTLNAWKNTKKETIGTDTRTLSFWGNAHARSIDLEMTLHASHGDLVFDEMKDGFVGIRTHPDLRLSARPDRGVKKVFGEALNSEGVTGKKVWGKRADWVHFYGTVEGKPAGMAFLSHPSNPAQANKKAWWHARDYGLIAANPFAPVKFGGDGRRVIPKGESLKLRYRFVFHTGSAEDAAVADLFAAYAADPGRPTPPMPK